MRRGAPSSNQLYASGSAPSGSLRKRRVAEAPSIWPVSRMATSRSGSASWYVASFMSVERTREESVRRRAGAAAGPLSPFPSPGCRVAEESAGARPGAAGRSRPFSRRAAA